MNRREILSSLAVLPAIPVLGTKITTPQYYCVKSSQVWKKDGKKLEQEDYYGCDGYMHAAYHQQILSMPLEEVKTVFRRRYNLYIEDLGRIKRLTQIKKDIALAHGWNLVESVELVSPEKLIVTQTNTIDTVEIVSADSLPDELKQYLFVRQYPELQTPTAPGKKWKP